VAGGVEVLTYMIGREGAAVAYVALSVLESVEQTARLFFEWMITGVSRSVQPPDFAW
jgi:hypothetical protein